MKKKDTNELIAQFMGLEKTKKGMWVQQHAMYAADWIDGVEDYSFLRYHESWDWLMPVVEKIKNIEEKEIDQFNKVPKEKRELSSQLTNVTCLFITADIKIVYKAVIEFIKWYKNENNTNS